MTRKIVRHPAERIHPPHQRPRASKKRHDIVDYVADRRRDWALDGRELAGLLIYAQHHPALLQRIRRAAADRFVIIVDRRQLEALGKEIA